MRLDRADGSLVLMGSVLLPPQRLLHKKRSDKSEFPKWEGIRKWGKGGPRGRRKTAPFYFTLPICLHSSAKEASADERGKSVCLHTYFDVPYIYCTAMSSQRLMNSRGMVPLKVSNICSQYSPDL